MIVCGADVAKCELRVEIRLSASPLRATHYHYHTRNASIVNRKSTQLPTTIYQLSKRKGFRFSLPWLYLNSHPNAQRINHKSPNRKFYPLPTIQSKIGCGVAAMRTTPPYRQSSPQSPPAFGLRRQPTGAQCRPPSPLCRRNDCPCAPNMLTNS